MADKKYDLFLSYNREDGEYVGVLARLLQTSGLQVWFDRFQMAAGQTWTAALEEAVHNSEAIGICVGMGPWRRREWESARANGLRCITILLPTAPGVPPEIAQFKALDFRHQSTEELTAELQALVRSFGHDAEPETTTSHFGGDLLALVLRFFSNRSTRKSAASPSATEPALASAEPAIDLTRDLSSSTDRDPQRDLQTARNILRGQAAATRQIVELAGRLKREKQFGYARQLLARARSTPADVPADLRLYLGQQHALCTYKDTHLPVAKRYDDALRILGEVENLRSTSNQETLGLAGAVYKSRWEAFGQTQDLEISADYYLRG